MGNGPAHHPISGVYIVFIISLLICCAIAYILGLFWFNDKRNRRLSGFFLLGAAVFFWTLLNAVSLICHPVYFPAVYTLRMAAVSVVPYGVAWFLLRFVNSPLCRKPVRALFIVLAAADILALVTNPLHFQYFADYSPPIPARAALFWIHMAVNFLTIGIAVAVSLFHMVRDIEYRPHLTLTTAGMLIPYIINLLWNFKVLPFTFDVTPIAFFVTFILFVYAAHRSGLLTRDYELEAARRTLTTIFESNPHMNIMFNSEFEVLDCNPSAISFMGFDTREELLEGFAERMSGYIPEYQSNGNPSRSLRQVFQAAVEEGFMKNEIELVVGGETRILEMELKCIPYGDSFALLGYMTDLTDIRGKERELVRRDELLREAMEEARSANQAKSAFLANMSHEIRTPMNSIMGFAELAYEKAVSPVARDYLGKITDSTKWLLRIINDILDISKIESGKVELEKVPFDLHSIFARCQSVIQPAIADKGLDLRVYAESPAGKRLLGDPVRLYQALMNLLSNAVKFTSSGTVKFSSEITVSGDATATIYFEVKDSGIGMTAGQIGRIFEPFMQADTSTTRNYGGTGLGLPITKGIVELMGGQLEVASDLGAGSTFSFELTFDTVDAPGDAPGGAHGDAPGGAPDGTPDGAPEDAGMKPIERPSFDGLILVCEDNPMNQLVISTHLQRVGLRSVIAENGKAGVDMVRERIEKGRPPFDMILMDIFMPVMDGVEAASRIAALGAKTPIVAMTANVLTSELDNYKKAGMHDCVGKPFTTQELWRCLLKYLKPSGASEAGEACRARDDDELRGELRDDDDLRGKLRNDDDLRDDDTLRRKLRDDDDLRRKLRNDDDLRDGDDLRGKLRARFFRDNQDRFSEITGAISEGDLPLALRLAHSLKGNAGQIGMVPLQRAAEGVESALKGGGLPDRAQMDSLGAELDAAIRELQPLYGSPKARHEPLGGGVPAAGQEKTLPAPAAAPQPESLREAGALLETLAPMIENINPECVNLLDDVRAFPEMEELARHIENYDFESASRALAELKKDWV